MGAGKSDTPLTRADVEQLQSAVENAAQLDLRRQNLQQIDLSYMDLQGANLQGADLQAANLRGTNLSGADLQAANLSENEQEIQAMWIGFAHHICDLYHENNAEA